MTAPRLVTLTVPAGYQHHSDGTATNIPARQFTIQTERIWEIWPHPAGAELVVAGRRDLIVTETHDQIVALIEGATS